MISYNKTGLLQQVSGLLMNSQIREPVNSFSNNSQMTPLGHHAPGPSPFQNTSTHHTRSYAY